MAITIRRKTKARKKKINVAVCLQQIDDQVFHFFFYFIFHCHKWPQWLVALHWLLQKWHVRSLALVFASLILTPYVAKFIVNANVVAFAVAFFFFFFFESFTAAFSLCLSLCISLSTGILTKKYDIRRA